MFCILHILQFNSKSNFYYDAEWGLKLDNIKLIVAYVACIVTTHCVTCNSNLNIKTPKTSIDQELKLNSLFNYALNLLKTVMKIRSISFIDKPTINCTTTFRCNDPFASRQAIEPLKKLPAPLFHCKRTYSERTCAKETSIGKSLIGIHESSLKRNETNGCRGCRKRVRRMGESPVGLFGDPGPKYQNELVDRIAKARR